MPTKTVKKRIVKRAAKKGTISRRVLKKAIRTVKSRRKRG